MKIQVTTNPIATIAFNPDENIISRSPYPDIEIGAKIRMAIPPPIIIKIHIAKIKTKREEPLKVKLPS